MTTPNRTLKSFFTGILSGFFIYWILLPFILFSLWSKFVKIPLSISLKYDFSTITGLIIIVLTLFFALKLCLIFWVFGEGLPLFFIKPVRLVKSGLYSVIRHPVYLFFVLYLFGLALISYSPIGYFPLVVVVFIFLLLLVVFIEEPKLKHRLGNSNNYFQHTNRFFSKMIFSTKYLKDSPTFLFLFLHFILQPYFRLRFRLVIEGLENIPEDQPAVFVSNHNSYLDPVFIAAMLPRQIHFLTTYEVYRKFLNRLFFNMIGSIPLKRHEPGIYGLRRFLKYAREGKDLGYFFEGERSWHGYKNPIPAGVPRVLAAIPNPIVPVALHGTYEVMPRWSNIIRSADVRMRFFPPLDEKIKHSPEALINALREKSYYFHDHGILPLIRKGNRAAGIHRLLWRCPECGQFDAIMEVNDRKFHCKNCAENWEIDENNRIVNSAGQKCLHHEAYRKIILKTQNEWHDLIRKDIILSAEQVQCYSGNSSHSTLSGNIVLRNSAVSYKSGDFLLEIELNELSLVQIEGNDRLHIIKTDRSVHRFYFPEKESVLKWHYFINTIIGNPVLE